MPAGVTVDAGWVDRGTTWSSAGTVTGWIPIVSEDITEDPEITRSEALGQVSQYAGEVTRLAVQGNILTELDYNYGPGLLKYALGAGAAGVYSTADELPYFGLEFDKGVSRWRYGSNVVTGLTISGAINGVIQASYAVAAFNEARSATAFPSIRPAASLQERVVFEDLTVRLGDTVNALASGDAIGISGFELTLDNAMRVDQSDSESNKRVLAPVRNGMRVASLRLDFPRYSSALQTGGTHPLDAWRAGHTQLQADLVFTGSSGTYTIKCPIMHLAEGGNANVGGPEVIEDSATFDLTGGVNANMTGDQLEIVNT